MKSIRILLLVIAAVACGSAMADTPKRTGETVNRSVDLVFKNPVKVDFQLVAEKYLNAGKVPGNTKLATFNISATPPNRLGIRWTPNRAQKQNTGQYLLTGTNDPKHHIYVYLPPFMGITPLADGDWFLTKDKTNTLSGVIKTHGDQNIESDIYTLSMDASAFVS